MYTQTHYRLSNNDGIRWKLAVIKYTTTTKRIRDALFRDFFPFGALSDSDSIQKFDGFRFLKSFVQDALTNSLIYARTYGFHACTCRESWT